MEADWDELSRIPVPPPSVHGLPTIATTVAFDDVSELLWTGNEYVSVLTYTLRRNGLWADCYLFTLLRAGSRPSADQICSGIPPSERTLSPKAWCGKLSFMNAV